MQHKKFILSAGCLLFSIITFSQLQFSIATDLAGVHSFKKDQRFNAAGQTILIHLHITPKDGAYVWYGYSAPGKFKNDFLATAKSSATLPQALDFKSYSQISFHSLSIGWKHYLKGAYNSTESWSLYFTAGFGLVGGKVTNTYTIAKDTSNYNFPANPIDGKGKFKRLTFDTALGYEIPIGMAIFLYAEARAWIPASDYPSKYLFVNENAPFIGTANIGLRILFD
ncbi:MAG: hypothetical protein JWM28_1959 [Chitinophagaceae bacterium]|nr:hypothetical protein [Chitinophagaceae bacterium]